MTAIKKQKASFKKHLWPVLLFAAVFFLLAVAGVYFFNPKNVFAYKFSRILHLPAAYVFNAGSIALSDFNERTALAEVLKGQLLQPSERSDIFNQLVSDKIVESLAGQNKVLPSAAESAAALDYYKNISASVAEFYSLDQSEFVQAIILPDLRRTKLAVWLSGNSALNSQAYQKLATLKANLQSGANFEDLAQQYSEDAKSAAIGGDLGFLSYKDVVPEIYAALAAANDRDLHIVNSRFGIHLFKVLGADSKGPNASKRYHIKQIFIKTLDFDKWLNSQEKDYNVLKFENPAGMVQW